MKVCSKCGESKALSGFAKDSQKKDGLYSSCKSCMYAMPGRLAATARWRSKNADRIKAYKRATYAPVPRKPRDPSAPARAKAAWKNRNKAATRADRALRRAIEARAVPAWANRFVAVEAFDLARRRTESTGFKWHVDHIVPLRSPLVCGLHCDANFAVIPGAQNQAKSNRWWPDMPS